MKYRELPKAEIIQKLMSICFATPAKNLNVYKFCNAITPMVQYVENERVKLVAKHGKETDDGGCLVPPNKVNDFYADYTKTLEMDITDKIPVLELNENDFGDNCVYSSNKEMWLNPAEIAGLLEFSKMQRNERKG